MPRDYRWELFGKSGTKRRPTAHHEAKPQKNKVLAARQKAWDDMKPGAKQGTTRPGSQNRRK